MAVMKEDQRPPSRKSSALDKLAVSSSLGTSGHLGGGMQTAPKGDTPRPRSKQSHPDRNLPSRAGSVASGTIPCGIPSSRGFQTEYRRKYSSGSRPGTQASSVSSLPGRAMSTAPAQTNDRTVAALAKVTRTLPHRPGTAQPPPALRPSTSGVGRSNHLKNEESFGWAPGIANGAAAYQSGSLDAASALLQRRPGSSASSAPPRTPVSRGQLIIPQQAATLRPSTAQQQQQQQQQQVLARDVGSPQSRFAPAVPPIVEEQQHQETWQPTGPPGAESPGSNVSQPQPINNEAGPSSGAAEEELVIMSDAIVKAPIATPRLPVPAADQSPPRSPAALKYRAEDYGAAQQDAPEIDLLHADIGQHEGDEPCSIGQAAPMVLNLEDLAQSTPEVLELEVENLDIGQLEKLEEKIRRDLEEVEAASQISSSHAASS